MLIVSFDGLRPDAIAAAKMTNVMSLIQTGASTFERADHPAECDAAIPYLDAGGDLP